MLFLFISCFLNNFLKLVVIKNSKLKLGVAIPTGAPVTVKNDAVYIPPLVVDKTMKDLSK